MENVGICPPMTIDGFLALSISVTKSLVDIHKKGGIHGFVNPKNINWEKGSLKTEMVDSKKNNKKLLMDPARLPYVSPEQTQRFDIQIDQRSDLYSLGIIFYELLVGETPFVSKDPLELIHSHLALDVLEPHICRKEIPKQISSIIMLLLEKDVNKRYQSSNKLQIDLEKCHHQWKEKGIIEEFELEKTIFSSNDWISKKIYGRDKELNNLIESFERISSGKRELFAISGSPGAGKTTLVHRFTNDSRTEPCLAIEGKFDQYHYNKPYSAWTQAFNKLVQLILMESQDRLSNWRTEIQKAVGRNGKVLTDVFQNLELIIGPQPDVIELSGVEAQNRFNSVIQKFVKAIASKELPLIIFLDDLQWIDSASISLLRSLVSDPDLNYVQYILSYRDNEVDASHPMILLLNNLKKETGLLRQQKVQNLLLADINSLLSDSLNSSLRDTLPLAEMVYSKTLGNPFFTHKLLQFLNEEKHLVLDDSKGVWDCDTETIKRLDVTDNVAAILSKRIRKYPAPTIETLKLAACIGNTFDLETLSILIKEPPEILEKNLKLALQDGIIIM